MFNKGVWQLQTPLRDGHANSALNEVCRQRKLNVNFRAVHEAVFAMISL
jgi:hypothetical protein